MNIDDLATRQRRIVSALAESPTGMTDWELHLRTGLRYSSVQAPRGDLRNSGWIIAAGKKRPTDSGYPATVWLLTPEAWEAV